MREFGVRPTQTRVVEAPRLPATVDRASNAAFHRAVLRSRCSTPDDEPGLDGSNAVSSLQPGAPSSLERRVTPFAPPSVERPPQYQHGERRESHHEWEAGPNPLDGERLQRGPQ